MAQSVQIYSELILRNLCAGEAANQGSILEFNGVAIISSVLRSKAASSGPDHGLVRFGLQVLANVSLAGKRHQFAIWEEFYPVVLDVTHPDQSFSFYSMYRFCAITFQKEALRQ
ncbi:hypothetical protein VNO78_08710 [Psophocarpus tetragonolobus]|uniref:Uncharacterized protein n=1 Tax=Psophocarpus tetragonolobus TaxID=3891 RepID=A0AAN9SYH7_PSOTE